MKKILILLFIAGFYFQSNGQMVINENPDAGKKVIGEIAPFGGFIAKCVQYVSESEDTTYVIYFRNNKYQTLIDIQNFSFTETGNDFNTFTNLIITNLKNKEKKDVVIKLADGILTLSFNRFLGVGNVSFKWFKDGVLSYSADLTLTQCKKLFGNNPEWK